MLSEKMASNSLTQIPGTSRRAFLQMGAQVALGGVIGLPLLSACSSVGSPGGTSGSPSTSKASGSGSSAAALRLPAYVPVQAAKPDFPPSVDGVDPAYATYPKNLFKAVAQTPGQGGDVEVLTQILVSPPPPVDQNPAWQEINRQVGASLKLNMVAGTDYPTRLSATIAGGTLPDMFYIPQVSNIQNLPQFMQSACADLTPYLAGDAVKDYPNLANYPTLGWKSTVYNGAIYGVPIPRSSVGGASFINQDRWDAVGDQPKNADDFKRMLQALTHAQSNQWGMASANTSAYGLAPTTLSHGFHEMFGAPNNWQVDSSGKFIKDIEAPEFKAAVGYVRDLYAAGVYSPNTATYNQTSAKTDFVGGKFSLFGDGWFSYSDYWDRGANLNPPVRFRVLHPFGADGGKGRFFLYSGFFGIIAMKKASADRIKELLRILNYLASPFGSQESLLLEYGIKDVDFIFNAKGNPILTTKGQADTNVSWRYITQRPQVLFDPNAEDFAKVSQADEQAMIAVAVPDPSIGLYSATNQNKGGTLMRTFVDGLTQVVNGQRPLTDYDQLVQDWRTGGGDQMRTEYQQAYVDSKK